MRALNSLLRIAAARRYWRQHPCQPVALMHVPKTAGTSVMSAIATALCPRTDLRGFDASLFGDFDAWHTMRPSLRAQIYLNADEMPGQADTILGHFAASSLRARFPNARLITFMREPSSRILSHFAFWRAHTDAMLEESGPLWSERVKRARGSLEDFLADPSIAPQTDNVLLRMLLWPHDSIPPAGFINPRDDAALLAEARARLARFGHVGLVEAWGGIFPALNQYLGCRLPERRLNAAPAVPPALQLDLAQAITPRAQALLEARGRLDLVLWQELAAKEASPSELRARALAQTMQRLSASLRGGMLQAA